MCPWMHQCPQGSFFWSLRATLLPVEVAERNFSQLFHLLETFLDFSSWDEEDAVKSQGSRVVWAPSGQRGTWEYPSSFSLFPWFFLEHTILTFLVETGLRYGKNEIACLYLFLQGFQANQWGCKIWRGQDFLQCSWPTPSS